jgi:Lysylphosphatidylglycerol synthase TM region
MTRTRAVQLLLFLAALVALLWLLNKIGWSNIGQALLRVGLGGALMLAALGLSETILDSAAMAVAIGHPRAVHVLFINSLGAVLNQILPFELGEVAKAGFIHRMFPGEATIAGSIVWNYVFKISRPIVTMLAALIGFIWATQVGAKVRYLIVAGALLSFVPYVVLRLVLRQGAAVLIVRLMRFVRILRRDPERILAAAVTIDITVKEFWQQRPGAFLTTLLFQTGARLVSWSGLFVTLQLIGQPISFTMCALLYAAMNTAELIITIIPARLGVAEGAAFGIFKLIGLPSATGVIMYVILRLKSLAMNGALAPFAFLPTKPRGTDGPPAAPTAREIPAPRG